jgi:methylated-DNA-[protein]-cysteine S-methyltransferase
MDLRLESIESPVGKLLVVTDHRGCVYAIDFVDYRSRMDRLLTRYWGSHRLCGGGSSHDRAPGGGSPSEAAPSEAALSEAAQRLQAYFAGSLSAIDSIETCWGGSPFQQKVWRVLRTIPCGETVSYGWIAKELGMPSAARAVGLANGSNPIAIVVPCHRVIGSNRKLTGYAGGLERKQWLLDHEADSATAFTRRFDTWPARAERIQVG